MTGTSSALCLHALTMTLHAEAHSGNRNMWQEEISCIQNTSPSTLDWKHQVQKKQGVKQVLWLLIYKTQ